MGTPGSRFRPGSPQDGSEYVLSTSGERWHRNRHRGVWATLSPSESTEWAGHLELRSWGGPLMLPWYQLRRESLGTPAWTSRWIQAGPWKEVWPQAMPVSLIQGRVIPRLNWYPDCQPAEFPTTQWMSLIPKVGSGPALWCQLSSTPQATQTHFVLWSLGRAPRCGGASLPKGTSEEGR